MKMRSNALSSELACLTVRMRNEIHPAKVKGTETISLSVHGSHEITVLKWIQQLKPDLDGI